MIAERVGRQRSAALLAPLLSWCGSLDDDLMPTWANTSDLMLRRVYLQAVLAGATS